MVSPGLAEVVERLELSLKDWRSWYQHLKYAMSKLKELVEKEEVQPVLAHRLLMLYELAIHSGKAELPAGVRMAIREVFMPIWQQPGEVTKESLVKALEKILEALSRAEKIYELGREHLSTLRLISAAELMGSGATPEETYERLRAGLRKLKELVASEKVLPHVAYEFLRTWYMTGLPTLNLPRHVKEKLIEAFRPVTEKISERSREEVIRLIEKLEAGLEKLRDLFTKPGHVVVA